MIILAGEAGFQEDVKRDLALLGYVIDDHLVNLHTKGLFPTAPAATQESLMAWLTDRPAVTVKNFVGEMDKSPVSGNEWVARIRGSNQSKGDLWYIHDFRVLWFLDEFVKVAGDVKIVALVSDETPYHQAIKRFLDLKLEAGLPVLRLSKPPTKGQIEKFIKSANVTPDDAPTLNEIASEG